MKIDLPQAMAAAVLVAASAFFVSAQNVDRQKEAIRKAYSDANAKIAAAESDPGSASVYINELRLNSGRASWPAVGIYNSTIKFYYEIPGEGPYPNSLFKVNARTERSARVETEQFFFNDAGKLIFFFGNDGDAETRAYFADGRAIRLLKGTVNIGLATQRARAEIAAIQKKAGSFSAIFRNSGN